MLNDYEIKVEIEKIKLWSCWLCERVCKLESLDNVVKPPIEEEEEQTQEEDYEPPWERGHYLKNPYSIVYGDKVVIAGEDGIFYLDGEYSPERDNYVKHLETNPSIKMIKREYTSLAYGNGIYVLSFYRYAIYHSHDGVKWDYEEVNVNRSYPNIFLIKFCYDKFIALCRWEEGPSLPIWSYDGRSWELCEFENPDIFTNEQYDSIASNDRMIVITGTGEYRVIYTEDGINWKAVKDVGFPSPPGQTSFVTYGNGKFVAGIGGCLLCCEHPSNWEEIENYTCLTCLTFTGNRFIAWIGLTNTTKAFKSSIDGRTWKEEKSDLVYHDDMVNFKYIIDNVAFADCYDLEGQTYMHSLIGIYSNGKWYIQHPLSRGDTRGVIHVGDIYYVLYYNATVMLHINDFDITSEDLLWIWDE